jgi:hypothetical protein
MMRLGWAAALTVCGVLSATAARADDDLLKFDGAIGVIPVTGGGAANIVFGVNPGGQPWVLRTFKANVGPTGKITAKGSGLLFGGGNNIGTRGTIANVALTLFCGGVAHSTGSVALDLHGNFSVKGADLNPALPLPCATPVLLVRSFGTAPGNWFAAGIPAEDD